MAKYDYRKHSEGSAEYKGVKDVPVPETAGYPNNIASTQTEEVRGTGAQTKATKSSKKLG